MKVILPSKGILGTKYVELRQPTFSDLRAVHNMESDESLLKINFVKILLGECDLNKITKYDMDYLYLIAVCAMNYNEVSYSLTCDCGEKIKFKFNLATKDVEELKKIKQPYLKKISGLEFKYHILSAQNEVDARLYALSSDNYDDAYQDAVVALTLGYSLDDIESKVHKLPVQIYISTFLFQKVVFHGIPMVEIIKCPSCSESIKVNLSIGTDLIKVDLHNLMNNYVNLHSILDFDAYMSLTVPEFNTLSKTYLQMLER